MTFSNAIRSVCFAVLSTIATAADPQVYFGGTSNEAYLDWLGTVDYTSSMYLPSAADPADGAAVHWNIVTTASSSLATDGEGREVPDDAYIELGIAVRATGWVGFGLSENGGMTGSDMFIFEALVDTETVWDAFVTDERMPKKDECQQDWEFIASSTANGFLIVQVKRKLVTGDTQDLPIIDDSDPTTAGHRIIAAWGDDQFGYHGPKVSRSAVRYFGVESDEVEIFRQAMDTQADGSFKLLTENYAMPAADTDYAYFCFTGDMLRGMGIDLDQGTTLIGFDAVVDVAEHLHHFIIYASYEENNGAEQACNSSEDLGVNSVVYAWAPGQVPFSLPEDVGFLVGGKTGFKSFMLEVHYDNPGLVEGVVDNSGVELFFTNTPREHEAGILVLGDPMTLLDGSSYGSGVTAHSFTCTPDCSNLVLGDEGITVFGQALHMHRTGIRASAVQYRNGEQIHAASADYFDFEMQGGQTIVQPSYKIMPGDSFTTTCYYKEMDGTTGRFGFSSQEEMCQTFMMYYPVQYFAGTTVGWTCGVGIDNFVPSCGSEWVNKTIEDPSLSNLGRTFGLAQCKQGGGVDVASSGNGGTSAAVTTTSTSSMLVGTGFAAAAVFFV